MPRLCFRPLVHRIVAGLAWCLGPAGMLHAAGEPAVASAPFVRDDARLFDAAAVESMNRALVETERVCGVSVYVATLSYLETAGSRNHEQQLVERLLHDQPGVILTYNRGDGQTAVVPSPELWRRHPADEIARILADAGRILAQPGSGPEQRIQNTVTLMVDRFHHLNADRPSPRGPFSGVERKLAIAVAATIAVAGLAGWLGACVLRRKAATIGGPFFFPDATANTRLGGQFGGGSIGDSSAPRPD